MILMLAKELQIGMIIKMQRETDQEIISSYAINVNLDPSCKTNFPFQLGL